MGAYRLGLASVAAAVLFAAGASVHVAAEGGVATPSSSPVSDVDSSKATPSCGADTSSPSPPTEEEGTAAKMAALVPDAAVRANNARQVSLDFYDGDDDDGNGDDVEAIGGGREGIIGGRIFNSVKDFWEAELGTGEQKQNEKKENNDDGGKSSAVRDIYDVATGWYGRAQSFWASEPPTIDGVLGNSTALTHAPDIRGTRSFLAQIRKGPNAITLGKGRALDVGAGMGRVAELILASRFATIDIIEPSPRMADAAEATLRRLGRLGSVWRTSAERVVLPQGPTYDLVLMQWIAMYLTDNDLVAFLKSAKQALRNGTVAVRDPKTKAIVGTRPTTGIILVKENVAAGAEFVAGTQDLSINRCDAHYKALFRLAGLRVIAEAAQTEWPRGYVPVRMYALA